MSLITEAQIRGLVLVGEAGLSAQHQALWETIRIDPEVWPSPRGAEYGFGFWVVARHEGDLVWYDSIAEEFRAGTTFGERTVPEPVAGAKTLDALFSQLDL